MSRVASLASMLSPAKPMKMIGKTLQVSFYSANAEIYFLFQCIVMIIFIAEYKNCMYIAS